MIKKVLKYIKDKNMIQYNDKIVVAVSGGPDSICLLHILNSIKDEFNAELVVAHVNHCLRGEEADLDEKYVEEFSYKLGIPFYSAKIDINKMCRELNMSHEVAGRKARYEFFEEVLKKSNSNKVALAHNANDQAETILMRLMRGAGIEGLIGIKPIRDDIYIRPILSCDRIEVEKYCEINNLKPHIDKTNLESIYTRNKIRLELIPYMKQNFNSDIVNVLNRLSDILNVDSDYLDKCSNNYYKKYCYISNNDIIIFKEAFEFHEAMVIRVIRKAIDFIKGNSLNIEKTHINNVIELQKGETGKSINLPDGVFAYNNYGDIKLSLNESCKNKFIGEKILNFGENIVEDLNLKITITKFEKEEYINLSKNKNVKFFDYDKIKGEITVRTRREGDKFIPLGMNGYKKLKDLFIDLKIPKHLRDDIPIICFGGQISYVVDCRVSEKFKVDKNTKNLLEIKVEKEN